MDWVELRPGEEPVEMAACIHTCHDLKPDEAACNWWQLIVDEGRASVQCAACRCTYDPLTWDGDELLHTEVPIPVSVIFVPCANGYHSRSSMANCDCGWSVFITPRGAA